MLFFEQSEKNFISEENIPLKILIYIKYILSIIYHVSIFDASMMYSRDTASNILKYNLTIRSEILNNY